MLFGSLTVTLIFLFSHSINYGVRSAKISKYGYGFFSITFGLHVLEASTSMTAFFINWPLYHCKMSSFTAGNTCLKNNFADINIPTRAFLCLLFIKYIFSCPFILQRSEFPVGIICIQPEEIQVQIFCQQIPSAFLYIKMTLFHLNF